MNAFDLKECMISRRTVTTGSVIRLAEPGGGIEYCIDVITVERVIDLERFVNLRKFHSLVTLYSSCWGERQKSFSNAR